MLHLQHSAQKVLLCDLCEKVPIHVHCQQCNVDLCKACTGEHLSDSPKRHNVVPILQRESTVNYAKCPNHTDELCKHYCEKCDIPICSTCLSSSKHKDHDKSDILDKFESKYQSLQSDLKELKFNIYRRYEQLASDVQTEKSDLELNCEKLTASADQQGEIFHREITDIVNQRKSDIQEMKSKYLSTLNKNTEEITKKITELKQSIADLESLLQSNDVSLTSIYRSRNSEFRSLPPKVRVTLPSFSPQKINRNQLNGMFGSLSSLSYNTGHGGTMKTPEAVSSPPVKPMMSPDAVSSLSVKPMQSPEAVSSPPIKPMESPEAVLSPPVKTMKSADAVSSPVKSLLVEPRFTATIDTEYYLLFSVRCLREQQVWTMGNNKLMKLFNSQGKILTSIQTESGGWPEDIAVTRDGDLVYIKQITL